MIRRHDNQENTQGETMDRTTLPGLLGAALLGSIALMSGVATAAEPAEQGPPPPSAETKAALQMQLPFFRTMLQAMVDGPICEELGYITNSDPDGQQATVSFLSDRGARSGVPPMLIAETVQELLDQYRSEVTAYVRPRITTIRNSPPGQSSAIVTELADHFGERCAAYARNRDLTDVFIAPGDVAAARKEFIDRFNSGKF
jgi:hypothetical protein